MTDKKLDWKQTEDWEWRAISSMHDEGSCFEWVIVTHSIGGGNDDGIIYFCLGNSAAELLPEGADEMVLRRLGDAQLFCNILENHHRNICDIEALKIKSDTKVIGDAMQAAWNEHCDDTGCYPEFLEIDDLCAMKAFADFSKGNFAENVSINLKRQYFIDETQIPADILAKHNGDA